jgi:hypothetical protein
MGTSVFMAVVLASYLGYRGPAFFIFILVAGVLLFFLGVFVDGIVSAPGFKRVKGKPFDKTPSLLVDARTREGRKPTK